jgi:glycolate oxidase FAD binding subunit
VSEPFAIAGVEPRAVVSPPDTNALAALVRELAAGHKPYAFVGGGTQLELGNPPAALDTVVRTTACARVLEYAPEDQTITVEAGMTIAAVQRTLDPHAQVLAIDVADPEHATVGGAIAANAFGRRRTRYGTIKDNIVGIGIVRPDGTRARGGGKVVKNVAGFDLPKIMVGALGTLGAVVEATFRLHPADERAGAVRVRASAAQAYALAQATVDAALVPDSVAAYDVGPAYAVVVRFGGFARGVEDQLDAMRSIASALGLAAERIAEPELLAYEERERTTRRSPWTIRVGAAPVRLAEALTVDHAFSGTRRIWYPLLGSAVIGTDDLEPARLAAWRERLSTAILERVPAAARASVESWGPPPPAFAIMQRLKARFDPDGLCNPGRFVGGL